MSSTKSAHFPLIWLETGSLALATIFTQPLLLPTAIRNQFYRTIRLIQTVVSIYSSSEATKDSC